MPNKAAIGDAKSGRWRRTSRVLAAQRTAGFRAHVPIWYGGRVAVHDDAAPSLQAKLRVWGVGRIGVDEEELDRRFRASSSASTRFNTALTLSLLAWSLSHANDTPIGLRGTAGGVRRGAG
jgi:hypothetical protein